MLSSFFADTTSGDTISKVVRASAAPPRPSATVSCETLNSPIPRSTAPHSPDLNASRSRRTNLAVRSSCVVPADNCPADWLSARDNA